MKTRLDLELADQIGRLGAATADGLAMIEEEEAAERERQARPPERTDPDLEAAIAHRVGAAVSQAVGGMNRRERDEFMVSAADTVAEDLAVMNGTASNLAKQRWAFKDAPGMATQRQLDQLKATASKLTPRAQARVLTLCRRAEIDLNRMTETQANAVLAAVDRAAAR